MGAGGRRCDVGEAGWKRVANESAGRGHQAALLLSFQLGVGLVIGLVIYQILFVVAVARIIFVQGGAL